MQAYLVGGYVRDRLLRESGVPVPEGDRDWVVVGATPEEMLARGFRPVGADFPVFLHPETHEEYALARTEKKTAAGYHGFRFCTAPGVTLEEDLMRRDLTVNAMAEDAAGNVIDPFGGREDLERRVLRHVSPAFAEDPVRILRAARFAARFGDFEVAPETMSLMRRMVESGEADALVAERVWAEISRGLMEAHPVRMIEVLAGCGAWERATGIPLPGERILGALENAAREDAGLPVRAAVLFYTCRSESAAREALNRLRVPKTAGGAALLALRISDGIMAAETAAEYSAIFAGSDILRRPRRFADSLAALRLLHGFDPAPALALARAWAGTDAASAVRGAADPAAAVAAARRQAVSRAMSPA